MFSEAIAVSFLVAGSRLFLFEGVIGLSPRLKKRVSDPLTWGAQVGRLHFTPSLLVEANDRSGLCFSQNSASGAVGDRPPRQ